jgi:hypothetical protein
MSGANKDTLPKNADSGRDDPKGWEHTGIDTLRDPKGGTYGTARGQDDPDNVKEHATPREKPQSGADVRPDVEPMPETLPQGLQHERKGPYGKTTGRR